MKSREVEITAVHDVEGAGFDDQIIQNVDIMDFAVGDLDEGWNGASQIQECVQFDSSFVFAKSGPWKKGKTEVNGGGIECIGRFFQFGTEGVIIRGGEERT